MVVAAAAAVAAVMIADLWVVPGGCGWS